MWLAETWEYLEICFTFDPMMIVWAAVICVLLTVARVRLNKSVLEVGAFHHFTISP